MFSTTLVFVLSKFIRSNLFHESIYLSAIEKRTNVPIVSNKWTFPINLCHIDFILDIFI